MRPVKEATYKAAPLPKHRIKIIGKDQYIMLDRRVKDNDELIITRRKIGPLKRGAILKAKTTDNNGVGVYANGEDGLFRLRHTDYRVLCKMTEPRHLPITVYGKGNSEMLGDEGVPTLAGYDHTLINMTGIVEDGGHTLVLELPGDVYVTACINYANGNMTLDIKAHENGQNKMFIRNQEKDIIRQTEKLY